MSLKCGIVGLTNSGKTTLFQCMTGTKTLSGGGSMKANLAMINVPDNRLKELESFQKTEKLVSATVEIVDIPGLTKGSTQGDGIGSKFLAEIRQTDAIIHVIRCFDNPSVPHIEGSIDAVRDREIIDLELQVKDLESVEKKILKYEKLVRIGEKDAAKGLEVLKICKNHLESFQAIRTLEIDEKDKQYFNDLCLLTDKAVLYVCNVDSDNAAEGNKYSKRFIESLNEKEKEQVLVLAAGLESDIAELDEEDRQVFLDEYNLHEPGVNKLVRHAYEMLNLKTFFTVGPKEIRAWTITQGMSAPQAAGVIHSDLERGFIRAEVMRYKDFIHFGTEHKCREAGKLSVEGKNYIVNDGDILHIRFNV